MTFPGEADDPQSWSAAEEKAEILADPELVAALAEAEADRVAGRGIVAEQVMAELDAHRHRA